MASPQLAESTSAATNGKGDRETLHRLLAKAFGVTPVQLQRFPNFLRNSRPNFAQYISERPEMISHDENSKKVNTTKGNLNMKKRNIAFTTILLLLGCLALSPAVQAAGVAPADDGHGIVGLWNVHYFVGTTEIFQTYDQWHSDGLEFEVNSIYPGAVCQGTWKHAPHDSVKLLHVIWTFDANGVLTGHIEETQVNTVSHDHNTYQGTFDQKFYDLSGNFLGEATGTLSATRLSVQ